MILSLPIFALLVAPSQNPATQLSAPHAEVSQSLSNGDCSFQPRDGGDARSKVVDIVRHFNLAIICKDRDSAMRLVAQDGSVSEIEEYIADDGKPVRWVGTGSWAEQLFLFTRPDSDTSVTANDKVMLGQPQIIIDGSAAMVRQSLLTQSSDELANDVCLIQHFMLAEDSHGWKIRHMMLVPDTNGCGPQRP